jgi:hypothetical protein
MKKLVIGLVLVAVATASCGTSRSGYAHSCSKQNKRYVHNSFTKM